MSFSAPNIVFRMRWMVGIALLAIAAALPVALTGSRVELPSVEATPAAAETLPSLNPSLAALAERSPSKRVEVIVQLNPGTTRADAAPLVRELGGKVTRDLHIINAVAAKLPAAGARELASRPEVRAVSPNAAHEAAGDGRRPRHELQRSRSRRRTCGTRTAAPAAAWAWRWSTPASPATCPTSASPRPTSARASSARRSSIPDATTATDRYGHGTHVAGIIAGDSSNRDDGDPLKKNRFMGVAPNANLVSIKVSDDEGNATVLDVIAGIQFAVDHKAEYNIRVLNLSLESTATESYKTDPLDAAVEAAWFKGIFVVVAAGNRGPGGDAVHHAPGNDPYVVTVGAVDDNGTKEISDDAPTSWSSRGTTQDGFAKPDIYAPGAKIVSNLAPNSKYTSLCDECVSGGGEYIRAGGTSMAAPMVAGAAAIGFQLDPTLTPNRIKALLRDSDRELTDSIDELSLVDAARRFFNDGGRLANQGLEPNDYINPATGEIDYTRSSWSRSSWSEASELLRSSWSRSSWSMVPANGADSASADPTRSSWSRSSWSRSSWSTSWTK